MIATIQAPKRRASVENGPLEKLGVEDVGENPAEDGSDQQKLHYEGAVHGGKEQIEVRNEAAESTPTIVASKPLDHRERHRVRAICQTLLAAIKLDHRFVNPSRFLTELKWEGVYNEFCIALQEQCKAPNSNWIRIVLSELSKHCDSPGNTRIALLQAVADGLSYGVVDDYGQVADCLLHYHAFFIEVSTEAMTDISGDADDLDLMASRLNRKRSGHGILSGDECVADVPLWFHICQHIVQSNEILSDTVLEIWKACWKNVELGKPWLQSLSLLTLQTMAIHAPEVDMVLHLCSLLLTDNENSHSLEALALLASLLDSITSEDTMAAKAITFHAMRHGNHLQECLLAMSRFQHRLSKLEFEIFIEVVVLRTMREGRDSEKECCLHFISDLCMPPTLFLNFDADYPSPNLWESILREVGNIAYPDEGDSHENDCGDAEILSREAALERRISSSLTIRQLSASVSKSPLNHLNQLSHEIILRILNAFGERFLSFSNDFSFSGAEPRTPHELFVRKKRKTMMQKVSESFNSSKSEKGSFLRIAVDGAIITSEDDAKGLARFFHECDDLDKTILGEYLSQGPVLDYPFHARVRKAYAGQFCFQDLSFAESLRKFLSNFRLPGEAQCIDRLMEVFSEELYNQQGHASVFRNADAVYVLSFSTIMLQTDLHNPTIKSELRMTKEQFIRNNRGINGGEDLPEAFVGDLYDKIKARKLNLRDHLHELGAESCADFRIAWDDFMSRKSGKPVQLSGQSTSQLSNAMFNIAMKTTLGPLLQVFAKSKDPNVVMRSLQCLDTVMSLSKEHALYSVLDDILQFLLPLSKSYILSCIANDPVVNPDDRVDEATCMDSTAGSVVPSNEMQTSDDALNDITPSSSARITLHSTDGSLECIRNRGLLATDRSFSLLNQYPSEVSQGSFLAFIDCLCALRDIRALPRGMSNLDDFADSKGNALPLSSFARNSQKKLDDYNRATYGKDTAKSRGWFRSFFRKGRQEEGLVNPNDEPGIVMKEELTYQAKMLLEISVAVDVESIVQKRTSHDHDGTIDQLLDPLDCFPFDNDPSGEQNAVFSLELAARALLSYSSRSEHSFLPFLSKFESILCKLSADDEEISSPFVIERIVVTILRSCIHLYGYDELLMMTLPRSFIRSICDRVACGLAIILRSSFDCFGQQEWSFMGDTLDTLATFGPSRVFVFDGIASTVEYSLSEDLAKDTVDNVRPELRLDACNTLLRILTRFVLGFYQSDESLIVPALLCLEKVYKRKEYIRQANCESITSLRSLDIDSWQNLAVTIYSACRSPDDETSQEGLACFRRNILNSEIEEIPSEKWVAIFYLIANKQPPMSAETSRGNTFAILGQLITRVLPSLSMIEEHREDLEDLVGLYTSLAEENLLQSNRGILFKSTLQTLTYVSNHLISNEWEGDKGFGCWASESFFRVLESANPDNTPKTTANAREEEDVSEISDSAAESELDE